MARRLLIFFGAPASGKTTLARNLVGLGAGRQGDWTVGRDFAALGDISQPVGGVDKVCARLGCGQLETAYVVAEVLAAPAPVAVLDHARCDVYAVERELRGRVDVRGVFLSVDPATCARRHEERGGIAKDERWYHGLGRQQQAEAAALGAPVVVDATQPAASVAHQVMAQV